MFWWQQQLINCLEICQNVHATKKLQAQLKMTHLTYRIKHLTAYEMAIYFPRYVCLYRTAHATAWFSLLIVRAVKKKLLIERADYNVDSCKWFGWIYRKSLIKRDFSSRFIQKHLFRGMEIFNLIEPKQQQQQQILNDLVIRPPETFHKDVWRCLKTIYSSPLVR